MRDIRKVILLSILVLVSCSPVKVVNVDSVDGFDLSNYKTFNFYEVELNGDPLEKPYSDRILLLKKEITKQLKSRGLQLKKNNPDLIINLGIVVEERVQTRPTQFGTDGPWYVGQRRYTWKSENVEVGRYDEGTVTVHLVDFAERKMVWRGVAAGVIPKNANRLEKDVQRGMEELFGRLDSSK